MADMENIAREIREFVVANFLYGDDNGLTDDQSFLDTGIVDSTGVLELVGFLEQHFAIAISDRELLPIHLDSVGNAARFVSRKREALEEVRLAG